MVQPVADQAAQQIGAAQHRRVGGRRAADHDVIAAASAGVAAVEHELLGAEPRETRDLVERGHVVDQLAPARDRLHVDLEYAGVGRDRELLETRIERRQVALERDRRLQFARRRLDRSDQFQEVVHRLERWHEHVQATFARFDRERSPHHPRRRLARFRRAIRIGELLRVDQRGPRRVVHQQATRRTRARRRSFRVRRKRAARRHRIERLDPAHRVRLLPRETRQRQPKTDRRVARDQHEVTRPQHPCSGLPLGAAIAADPVQRQHRPDGRREAALEDAAQSLARLRIVELVVVRLEVDRKMSLFAHVVPRVFIGRHRVRRVDSEFAGECLREALRVIGAVTALHPGPGDQFGIDPDRRAVAAPVRAQRPARQRLAGVPLAHPEVQQRAGGRRATSFCSSASASGRLVGPSAA